MHAARTADIYLFFESYIVSQKIWRV